MFHTLNDACLFCQGNFKNSVWLLSPPSRQYGNEIKLNSFLINFNSLNYIISLVFGSRYSNCCSASQAS